MRSTLGLDPDFGKVLVEGTVALDLEAVAAGFDEIGNDDTLTGVLGSVSLIAFLGGIGSVVEKVLVVEFYKNKNVKNSRQR
jgi:hypothetical protein